MYKFLPKFILDLLLGLFGTQLQRETSTFLLIFSVVLHSLRLVMRRKYFLINSWS
jgi:hypothetical protein